MRERGLAEFADLVGGTLLESGSQMVRGVATDSRRVGPGSAFVALRGEQVDGHEFCSAAAASGAACAVVERPVEAPVPRILVGDALEALARMGRGLLAESGCAVLALTGSVGKTTTREMLGGILEREFAVAVAPENYNTEVGVPLAISLIEPGDQLAVLEYAMRGLGQIRYLAEIGRPRVSGVVNVRTSHIEILGSRDAIAEAKSEILSYTDPSGVCCVNRDDSYAGFLLSRCAAPALTFGLAPEADVRATEVHPEEGATRFVLTHQGARQEVRIPAPGAHLVTNALCAAAMALAAGISSLEAVAAGLEAFRPAAHRGQLVHGRGGLTVIDDCYNAAPDSMRAALEVLSSHPVSAGRRVAVLGDMLELGDRAPSEHRSVGRLAAEAGVELLVTVGERAREIASGAIEAGLGEERVVLLPDSDEAAERVPLLTEPGDVVLVKGSRGIRLERVVNALAEEAAR